MAQSDFLFTILISLIYILIPIIVSYFVVKKDLLNNPKKAFWKMPLITSLWAIIFIIIGEVIIYAYILLLEGNMHGGAIEIIWIYYFPIVVVLSFVLSIILYFLKLSKHILR